jgi:dipeptidyl aminopeptidase/acylaminoacyl peptidase
MPGRASGYRSVRRICLVVALLAPVGPAFSQTETRFDRDPALLTLDRDIIALLDAEPAPRVSVDPAQRYLLLVRSRQLLPIARLAEPAVDLAGRRVNPSTAVPHAPIEYFALTLVDLVNGTRRQIALPRGAVIGYPQWAPDGSRFAFSLTRPGNGMELWIGEPAESRARPLLTRINSVRSSSCAFTANSTELLCRRLVQELPRGEGRTTAVAPPISRLDEAVLELGPALLDSRLVRNLLESQLELVDTESGQRHPIGAPAAFERVSPAPAGAYLLVERIVPPYPQYSGVDPVSTITEVWDRFGNVVAVLPHAARSIDWQATRPARLVWVERHDGTDRLMALDPPFRGAAKAWFELEGSFAGLRWVGNRDAAIVSDHARRQRETKLWYVPVEAGTSEAARVLTEYPSTRPRIPLMRVNRFGMPAVGEHADSIYVRGDELADHRQNVFLERIDLASGMTERVWSAEADGREILVDVLGDAADYLLVRRESPAAPPNYFVRQRDGNASFAVTDELHPVPALVDAERIRLEYARADGIELSASLYLPPGKTAEERLPLIVWAYPQRVPAGSSARLPDTTDHFPTFERAFRQFFLLRGYAILDDVSMPIVGDESTANDTFIDQVVGNAEAAVAAAVATGRIDVFRVGVAGHSYGAFMVANLLAHSKIFSAGVALSGAYNRTLTPFGFQTERRTLWDAPETYLAMSPVIYANRVEAPLLLVHGLSDDNAGTAPFQSTQFFKAIRGNGGEADLLLLPWEGHEYRARESVLRTAAGMLAWFDRHMPSPEAISEKNTGALLRP